MEDEIIMYENAGISFGSKKCFLIFSLHSERKKTEQVTLDLTVDRADLQVIHIL